MTAACPAPIPGRKDDKGAEIILPRDALKNSLFGILIFLILGVFCFGILILSFRLTINAEDPNNPVSNGSKGSFTGRFKAEKPINPAIKNITNAGITFCSLKIK